MDEDKIVVDIPEEGEQNEIDVPDEDVMCNSSTPLQVELAKRAIGPASGRPVTSSGFWWTGPKSPKFKRATI